MIALERIVDYLLGLINDIMPFTVIPHYNRGVRLRFGKKAGEHWMRSSTVLSHGFHWKIPFGDDIMEHMVKTTTMNVSEQSVTTKDGFSIVVASVVKYNVRDVETLLLEVDTAVDALNDMVKGIIRSKIIETNWAECNDSSLSGKISKQVKHEAAKWGIEVEEITLTDLGVMRSVRLLMDLEKVNKKKD